MTKPRSESEEKQFLSRNEGRKLFVMVVVLITMVIYLFQNGFKTDDPNQGGVPITLPGIGFNEPHELPTQDPVKARDALVKSEAAKTSGQATTPDKFVYDPKILQTVLEGGPEALNVVEEPALYHLSALVHGMSDEDLAAAPKTHGTYTWASLREREGRVAARGKFRTLQGRFLIPLTQRVLETYPNEADLVWVWQGILRVQNRGYFVTITDKNFEPEIGPGGTIIEVDAAFLKGHAYESRRGVVQLPHVIVKSFRKVKPPAEWDYMNSELVWGAAAAFVIAGILMVFYARRSRASAARFDDWRQKRLASKKAGTPKADKAVAASVSPSEVAPGVAPATPAVPAAPAVAAAPTVASEPTAEEPAAEEPAAEEPAAEEPAAEEPAATAAEEPAATAAQEPAAAATEEPAAATNKPAAAEQTEAVLPASAIGAAEPSTSPTGEDPVTGEEPEPPADSGPPPSA